MGAKEEMQGIDSATGELKPVDYTSFENFWWYASPLIQLGLLVLGVWLLVKWLG
jgi:hypothetical protein